MFEIITKINNSKFDIYDFYKDNLLNNTAYCNRDLSLTTTTYHKKLENIIKKCTKARNDNFTTSDKYYHSYKDLKKDLEIAKDSAPTIVKEEDVKVRTSFKLCGVMASLVFIFLIINSVYHIRSYKIAESKWNNLTSTYNETQFSKLSEIAKDYISAASVNDIDSTYQKIFDFTYQNNGDISDYEATMLVDILIQNHNLSDLPKKVDEIMLHADTSKFKDISSEIVKLDIYEECIGYELATAIYNVEVSKTNIIDAYNTLQKYKDNIQFKNAVIKLKYVIDNDENIQAIMNSTQQTREEVMEFLNSITK